VTNQAEQQHPRVAGVDRARAATFDWGSIQWLIDARAFADSRVTLGFVEIRPDRKNPRHYHPNCDEALFLLEGELDHSLGDQVFHLTPGTAIHIPAGAAHDATNRGAETARMIVAYSTGDRRTVWLEVGRE
jgi:quercetin dioxygenase-like cupin family protein